MVSEDVKGHWPKWTLETESWGEIAQGMKVSPPSLTSEFSPADPVEERENQLLQVVLRPPHTQNKCYKVRQVIRMVPFQQSDNPYRRETVPKASRTLSESIRQIFLFHHPIWDLTKGLAQDAFIQRIQSAWNSLLTQNLEEQQCLQHTEAVRKETERKVYTLAFWGKTVLLSFTPNCAILLWCLRMVERTLGQALVRTFRNSCGGVSLSPFSENTSVSHLVCLAPDMFCKLTTTEDILLVL